MTPSWVQLIFILSVKLDDSYRALCFCLAVYPILKLVWVFCLSREPLIKTTVVVDHPICQTLASSINCYYLWNSRNPRFSHIALSEASHALLIHSNFLYCQLQYRFPHNSLGDSVTFVFKVHLFDAIMFCTNNDIILLLLYVLKSRVRFSVRNWLD